MSCKCCCKQPEYRAEYIKGLERMLLLSGLSRYDIDQKTGKMKEPDFDYYELGD